MQGIYKITNQITHKSYIGKTKNYERRMADHKRLAFQLDHKESNKALYQSMRKYGLENFTFELIEELQDYTTSSNREKFLLLYIIHIMMDIMKLLVAMVVLNLVIVKVVLMVKLN